MEKFVGVFLQSNGKYKAYIAVNGKQIILGRFETFEEAKQARLDAEKRYGKPKQYRKVHEEIIGKKYPDSRLFVDSWGIDHKNRTIYHCTCECGNKIDTSYDHLQRGKTKSCGCLRVETSRKAIQQTYQKVDEIQKLARIDGSSAISLTQKVSKNSTTKIKGVSKTKYGYRAYINVARKQIHLGSFDTLEEAKHARMLAEEKYYQPILEEFNERLKHNKKA